MDSRQLPLASSSTASLFSHRSFASTATAISSDYVSAKEVSRRRKSANATLDADFDPLEQSSESPTLPADASSSFKPDNVDRAFFPLRAVGNLAFRRPKKAEKLNEKAEALLFRCLKLQSTHADAICPSTLALLKGNQFDLEDEAERLRKERDKALESTSNWYDQQCIKYKRHKDEVLLYEEAKEHHRQTKHVSEMAMRSKIDMAIGGKESLPHGEKGGKGKGRSRDDSSLLSRFKTKTYRSTHPEV